MGTFGDSFGPLTSLYSGLAFAAVVVSIWFQRQDLKQTQEELRASVEAQESMAKVMGDQLTQMKNAQEQNDLAFQTQIGELQISRELDLFHKYLSMGDAQKKKFISKIIDNETINLLRLPKYRDREKPKLTAEISSISKMPKQDFRYTMLVKSEDYKVTVFNVQIDTETVIEDERELGPRTAHSGGIPTIGFVYTNMKKPKQLSCRYRFGLTGLEYTAVFLFGEGKSLIAQEVEVVA